MLMRVRISSRESPRLGIAGPRFKITPGIAPKQIKLEGFGACDNVRELFPAVKFLEKSEI